MNRKLLSRFCPKVLGTPNTLFCFLLISLIASIPLLLASSVTIIAISIFSCKIFLEGAFMISYHANSELFPALFSRFALLVCGFMGHCLSVFAPMVAEIKPDTVPISVFLITSTLGILASLILTNSRPTLETVYKSEI
ncbi:unnamed protein product [Moneuplotes crassus]|uniref:Uncharacterized protein n=1 Tax=Euplotes crassus TaxID=5936 RepID=A0AAD1U4L9_EUPCR|nr:unnamed protein product [Moneuplotes crassus]